MSSYARLDEFSEWRSTPLGDGYILQNQMVQLALGIVLKQIDKDSSQSIIHKMSLCTLFLQLVSGWYDKKTIKFEFVTPVAKLASLGFTLQIS